MWSGDASTVGDGVGGMSTDGGSRGHGRGGGRAVAGGGLSVEAGMGGVRVGGLHGGSRIPSLVLKAFVANGETLGALHRISPNGY